VGVRPPRASGKMLAMRAWFPAPFMALALGVVVAAMIGASSWLYADRIEEQNDFCNSCHLAPDKPLHLEIREHFDRVIPHDLAGVHGRGWIEDRDEPAFRCIDCHAGAGAVERVKIRLLSARDGLRYAIGDFEEPHGMSFELSKELCRGCHPSFRHSAAPGWTVRAFHGLEAHDVEGTPRCVRCHAVHETDGDAIAYYMNRERVDRECQTCHAEGSAGEIPSLLVGARQGR